MALMLCLAVISCTILGHHLTSSAIVTGTTASIDEGLWAALNDTVGGRLFSGVPLAQPCFTSGGSDATTFDSASCSTIRANYTNETFLSDNFGGYIQQQWETCQSTGDQCLLDYTNASNFDAVSSPWSCAQGSVSEYYIDVTSASDVSAAFNFSRQTGVRVVVKNTGHDYKGRSSAPGSLGLWTHHLKNMTRETSFIAAGCNTSFDAVTLSAGVQFRDIYAYAESDNFTFVGGSDPGVGASGGWVQGGGHGALSNKLGLGVDRVVQFRVVTPDGVERVANACQNEDIFFALRGGGGGTFGVVLESTFQVAPKLTMQVAAVILSESNTSITTSLWSVIINNSLRWTEEGWGAFIDDSSALFITPWLNSSAANASMAPLLEYGASLNDSGVSGLDVIFAEFPSWGSFFSAFDGTHSAEVGANLAVASRLIPADNFKTESSRQELLDALLAAQAVSGGLRLLGSTPYNFPRDNSTSVTPAWQNSVYHVTLISPWDYNATLQEKTNAYTTASTAIQHLRNITPDAVYSNECDVHEPNHEVSFWGDHYDRLLEVKQKYDPASLLDCWQCVGWAPQAPQFECYI